MNDELWLRAITVLIANHNTFHYQINVIVTSNVISSKAKSRKIETGREIAQNRTKNESRKSVSVLLLRSFRNDN